MSTNTIHGPNSTLGVIQKMRHPLGKLAYSHHLYRLIIKHGNGKSPIDGGFNRKIINWIFQQTMFE